MQEKFEGLEDAESSSKAGKQGDGSRRGFIISRICSLKDTGESGGCLDISAMKLSHTTLLPERAELPKTGSEGPGSRGRTRRLHDNCLASVSSMSTISGLPHTCWAANKAATRSPDKASILFLASKCKRTSLWACSLDKSRSSCALQPFNASLLLSSWRYIH